jgi:Ni,Fe-hydrogenase maturation factor
MVKIFCLGNEFISKDSLAKKIGEQLKEDYNIQNIQSSFELMEILKNEDNLIILDVVQNLNEVKLLSISDLRQDSILSAHDFDAGFVLKLLGENKKIKIIGIPMSIPSNINMNNLIDKIRGFIPS